MSDETADNTARGGDEPSFEQAMERLEAILDRVESGEAGLEQSIAECEKGAKLIARCRRILDASEKRIGELNLEALTRAEGEAEALPADEAYGGDAAGGEPDEHWEQDEDEEPGADA
ncbi:MAG: exodeoxyribonuclease VII small subunit [Phycisphaeraceae bacterium]